MNGIVKFERCIFAVLISLVCLCASGKSGHRSTVRIDAPHRVAVVVAPHASHVCKVGNCRCRATARRNGVCVVCRHRHHASVRVVGVPARHHYGHVHHRAVR